MSHFTDEDIQNYVDGTFTGNIAALEDYIQQNPLAQQQVEHYRLMIKTISEQEVPRLTFDLAGAVISKVQRKKPRSSNIGLIAASVVTIAIVLWLLPFNSLFNDIDNPILFVILFMALCALLGMFHAPEIVKRRKIFNMK